MLERSLGVRTMRKICVVGTGYVGLVTGTCLADLGNDVTCLDVVVEKIERLRAGELPIYEPGLEPMVTAQCGCGPTALHHQLRRCHGRSRFIFIAVNTPTDA